MPPAPTHNSFRSPHSTLTADWLTALEPAQIPVATGHQQQPIQPDRAAGAAATSLLGTAAAAAWIGWERHAQDATPDISCVRVASARARSTSTAGQCDGRCQLDSLAQHAAHPSHLVPVRLCTLRALVHQQGGSILTIMQSLAHPVGSFLLSQMLVTCKRAIQCHKRCRARGEAAWYDKWLHLQTCTVEIPALSMGTPGVGLHRKSY